tara:strand:- start:6794 stop:13864 length:7071 start_codon:yes stop_codon:yes gene_type:complete
MAEQTPRGDNPFVDLFNPPDTREENPFTGLFNPPETPDPAPVNPFSGTPVVPPEENPFTGLFDPSQGASVVADSPEVVPQLLEPPQETGIARGGDFLRGAASAASSMRYDLLPTLGVQRDASAIGRSLERLERFNLLDAGATTEEIIEKFNDFSLYDQEYQAATPERRAEMRATIQEGVDERRQDIMRTLPELAERQAERQEKYGANVGAYEDIEGWEDFWNYITYAVGSGAAQFVPIVGTSVAGTALAGGNPLGGMAATLALTSAMAGQETVANRLEYIKELHSDLPPEEQAEAIAQYLHETKDVTAMVALGSGALDLGGVVGSIIRRQFTKQAGEELAKRGIKSAAAQIAGEGLTGVAQETLQVLGQKHLGEINDNWTSEEIYNRLLNAGFQEALGGLGGVTISEVVQKLGTYLPTSEQEQINADLIKLEEIEAQLQNDSPELSETEILNEIQSQMAELAKKGEAHESWLEGSWTTEPVDELTALKDDEIPIDPGEEQALAQDVAEQQALDQAKQEFLANAPDDVNGLTPEQQWDQAVERAAIWDEAMAEPAFDDPAATVEPTVEPPVEPTVEPTVEPPVEPAAPTVEVPAAVDPAQVAIDEQKENWIQEQLDQDLIDNYEDGEAAWNEMERRATQEVPSSDAAPAPQRLTPEFVESLNIPKNIKQRKWWQNLEAEVDLTTPQGRGLLIKELTERILPSKNLKPQTKKSLEDWIALAQNPNTPIETLVAPLITPVETTAAKKSGRVARSDPKAYQKEAQKDLRQAKRALSEFETLAKGLKDRREESGKHRQVNRLLNNWNLSLASLEAGEKPLLNHAQLENDINNLRQTSVNKMYDIINRIDEEGNFLHNRAHNAVITAKQALKYATEAELNNAQQAFDQTPPPTPLRASDEFADAQEYEPEIRNFTNARQLLKYIETTGTPAQKIWARRLKPFMTGVEIVHVEEEMKIPGFENRFEQEILDIVEENRLNPNEEVNGFYWAVTNKIYFFESGTNSRTALHEAFHAAVTDNLLRFQRDPKALPVSVQEAMQELIGLHEAFLKHVGNYATTRYRTKTDLRGALAGIDTALPLPDMPLADQEYLNFLIGLKRQGPVALTSLDQYRVGDPLKKVDVTTNPLNEFIAYALTDARFQQYLNTLPSPLTITFRDKYKNKYFSPKANTWMSELFSIFERMFSVRRGSPESNLLKDLVLVTDIVLGDPSYNAIPPLASSLRPSKSRRKKQTRAKQKIDSSNNLKRKTNAVGENYRNTPSRSPLWIESLKSYFNVIPYASLRILVNTLYSGQLVDWVGDKLPRLKGIKDATDRAVAQGNHQLGAVLTNIITPWEKFNRGLKNRKRDVKGLDGKLTSVVDRLSDLIHYTTLRDIQVDPRRAPTVAAYIKQDKKLQDLDKKINDPTTPPGTRSALTGQRTKRENAVKEVYEQWDLLPRRAKSIFAAQADFHKDYLQKRKALAKGRVEELQITDPAQKKRLLDEIDKLWADAESMEAYAPLGRQGSYFLTVVSKGKQSRFWKFDSLHDLDLYKRIILPAILIEDSDGAFGEGASIEELQDRNTYGDASYEITQGDLTSKDFREDLRNNSDLAIQKILELFPKPQPSGPQPTTAATAATVEEIRKQIENLYLEILPEGDARTGFQKRKETAGFSQDALRTFTATAIAAINQTNRLENAPKVRRAVEAAESQLRETIIDSTEKAKLQLFIDELKKRAEDEVGTQKELSRGMQVLEKGASLGTAFTFYSLLTSVKSALINPTQLIVFGLPELAQRFGTKATIAMMMKNSQLWNSLGVQDHKINIDGDVEVVWTMPTMKNSPAIKQAKSARMRSLLERAWAQGSEWSVYDDTLAADVYGRANTPSEGGRLTKGARLAMSFTSSFFRNSERLTREVMFMSSFELSFNKNKKAGKTDGEAYDLAINEAKSLDETSLFDYKRQSKPRLMKNPIGRFATQFMTYTFQAYYRMAKLLSGIVKPLPDKTRFEAAQVFFGHQLMTYMFAGLGGLWGAKWVFALFEILRDLFRPDEEDEDFREKIREWNSAGSGNPLGQVNLEYWFNEEYLRANFGENSAIADVLGLGPDAADLLLMSMQRGPLSALTGFNFSASLTLSGMGLRERIPDSFIKAMSDPNATPTEVTSSFQTLVWELFLGAPGAVWGDVVVGVGDLWNGEYEEGIKPFLPALLRGPVKAVEYSSDGILTRQGEPTGGFPQRTPAQQVLKQYAREIDLSAEYFQLNETVALGLGFSVTQVAHMRETLFRLQEQAMRVAYERSQVLEQYDALIQERNAEDDSERRSEIGAELNKLLRDYNNEYGAIYPLEDAQIETSLQTRVTARSGRTPRSQAGWSNEEIDRLADVTPENPFAGLFETGNN